MAKPNTSLLFNVRRSQPELVVPARPTPREHKQLSDIDDQEGLRFQVPVIQVYKHDPSMRGNDPVKVIKEAIAETLVVYYPLAGRLREGHNRKLYVDCTGEGVMFIEADANVSVDQFGDDHQYPSLWLEELLYDVPSSGEILNSPLLLIQVTRLKCGGFVFALRLNHTISDATGIILFMKALAEMARGACAPSIPSVWQRELLNARNPPRVTCTHHQYDEVADTKGTITPPNDMVHRSFFFSPTEISAIYKFIPHHLRHCSVFDALTAFLWYCRTKALQLGPEEDVHLLCVVNARSKFNPPLRKGY